MNPAGFSFSDGVTVPYGCYLSASLYTAHHLPENFANHDVFDGFFKLQYGKRTGVEMTRWATTAR
jgi:hypothetical protein